MAYESFNEKELGNAYMQMVEDIAFNVGDSERLQDRKQKLEAEMKRRGWPGAWDE